MLKKIILSTLILFISASDIFSQTVYTLNANLGTIDLSTSATPCSATFVDQGGISGNYSNNTSYTITFYSGNASSRIRMVFTSFGVEKNYDFLTIYDGSSTSSTNVGSLSGVAGTDLILPYALESTGSYLTVRFSSDIVSNSIGWEATLSCFMTCVPPTASASIANQSLPVKICKGESVDFSGATSTSGQGFSITNYSWDFDDGTTGNGITTSHIFNTSGIFNVNLSVTDNNGCTNINSAQVDVSVSTTPNFIGTTSSQTVCPGQNICLTGNVNGTPWRDIPPMVVSGTTGLPDGSGVCYETPLTFTDFGNTQTITTGNQTINVFANIEHTWAGDLTLTIICPNGQQVGLFNSDGTWNTNNISQENFGNADALPPTGQTYTWTSTGSTIENWGAANPSATSSTTIPSGTYGSEQPFSNLVGCPLNGTWKLKICDTHTVDDGTVFFWGINFDPSIYSGLPGFTPTFNMPSNNETVWSGKDAASSSAITSLSASGDQICVTPPSVGTYLYQFTTIDDFGCSYDTTITVTASGNNASVGVASSSPTLCVNSTLASNITHTTTGITSMGTPSNLPSGLSANFSSNTLTISGTSTQAGIFNYSIPLNGGCGSVNATGTIIVNGVNTVSQASSNPTLCLNSGISPNITFTTTGATGIGTPVGLPSGVSANFTSNTISINGTPTVAGVFNYTIPLTGGCGSVNATGTITVCNANSAETPTSTPSICINTALASNITISTTGATGIGTPTGLPNGISANFSSNTITIGGTPTQAGVFNYSIPLTGGCGSVNATGTITVNDVNTVSLTSSNPTLCENDILNPSITFTTTGATGIGFPIDLPLGVTANFASNTITISGTPIAAGVYNYTIPLTGGCGVVNATGTITVTDLMAASAPSLNPTICVNSSLSPDILISTTGASGIETPTGLPTGITANYASNIITISGTPTVAGIYNYSIPLTGGCGVVNATGTITINLLPNAGTITGVQNICPSATLTLNSNGDIGGTWSSDNSSVATIDVNNGQLTGVSSGNNVVSYNDATINSVSVVPTNGSLIRWEYSLDNAQWTPLTASATTYNYNNLTQSTWYRAVTRNGACNEAFSSVPVKITVADGGSLSATATSFCSPSAAATITATGIDGTSYAWEFAVSPYTVWTPSSANVATLAVSNLTQTTQYRINVNNGKAYSDPITMTVYPATVAGTLSTVNSVICENDATVRSITLSGNTGSAVRWESSFTNSEPWNTIENATSTLNFSNLAQTTYYRAIVQNGSCLEVATPSLVINVATGGAVGNDISVCESDANIRSLTLSNHNGVVNYWEKSEYNTGTSSWDAYANVGNAGNTTITYSNLTKSTRYRAVITSTCASPLTSSYATVTVYSASVAGSISGSKTIRSGSNSGNLTLTGNNGNVIRWESSSTGTAPWTSIANTTTTLTYQNVAVTTYYRAIVQNGPCSEAISTNTALLTVADAGYVSDAAEICASDATVRTLTLNNYIGTITAWQKSTDNGLNWNTIAGTNGNTTYNYSSLTQTTLYRAVITEDAGSIYSEPATITVNPLPTPLFSSTSVCDLNNTVFTNTSTIANGSILYTDWTFGDGTGETASNPSHIYPSDGTYTATLTLTSDKLCKKSISHPVTVYPLPIVDFAFNNVCDQAAVELTNNSNLPSYTLTYGWNYGDGNTSAISDPTYTYANFGSYDITLTATSNVGCIKTLTKTATIHENPVARFVSDSVCHQNTTSFTNNSTIGTGNLTYAWTFNDNGAISTLENPTLTFTNATSYSVKLIATSNFGCTDTVIHNAVIHPNPVPNYTTADNCFANVSNFTNTSTIASGSMTYNWDFNDGSSSIGLNPNHTYASAGHYVVNLVATSDYGCVKNIEKTITVNPNPTVNFEAANVCDGSAVNFLNYSTLNATNVSYNWNFADATTSAIKEPSHTYATSGTYNVKLKVTSDVGCVDSLTKAITVYPNPVSAFNTTDECFGATATFNNTSNVSSGTITTNTWDFGNGMTSSLLNPEHNYAVEGTYTVSLTTTSNFACTNTITHPINIMKRPVPAFSQLNVCSSDSMIFVNESSNLFNSPTYAWKFGDNIGTSTDGNPKYPYLTAGTYNVKLIVTNGNACSDSITKAVVVYPRTVVNFSFVNPCEGAATQFHNSSVLSSGSANYFWNFGGGITSTNPEPFNTYSSYGNYAVTLKSTTDKGCIDSLQKIVTVHQNPVVNFTVPNVCNNDSSEFTNTSVVANSTMTYAWNFGDQSSGTAINPVHLYATPGIYNVNLVATSSFGCIGQKSLNTQINPNPFANFNYTPVCEDMATTFENVSTIEAGTMTYLWDLGNGTTSTSTSPTVTYTAAGNKTITVVATSNYGCIDTASRTFEVYYAPVANFTVDTVCDGLSNTFTNLSAITNGTIDYLQWDFGDASNSLQTNPVHKFATAGTHAVTLLAISDKGCRNTIIKNAIVDYIPVPNFSADAVCLGNIMEFHDLTYYNPSTGGVLSYNWKMGDTNTYSVKEPNHLYSNSGIYTVTFTATSNIGNCTDSIVKQVVVNALPNVNAGLDTTVSKGWDYIMPATASQGVYQWYPSEGLSSAISLNPNATPFETTDYILEVTDINGCVNRDTMTLTVDKDYDLIKLQTSISNIITPDGNGENDTWYIKNISFYPENHVYIHNRWGELVYEAANYDNTWDATNKFGDTLPDGEYYYVITFEGVHLKLKGAITILRNLSK
ncbi:MAG: PKD domain-containing protein [Bacteroidota bacterium]